MNSVERKNTLLAKLASKELTLEQFLLKCALWSLETDCWIDYEVRQYPIPPKDWQEYITSPLEKRLKIPPEFFHQFSIREYLAMKSKIYALNWAGYLWLSECKKIIPDTQEYLEQHIRLDEKLIQYKYWFNDTNPEVERIREVFGGEEI